MPCTVEIKTAQFVQELRKATLGGEEASDPDVTSPAPPPPTGLASGMREVYTVPLAHHWFRFSTVTALNRAHCPARLKPIVYVPSIFKYYSYLS